MYYIYNKRASAYLVDDGNGYIKTFIFSFDKRKQFTTKAGAKLFIARHDMDNDKDLIIKNDKKKED